MFTRLLTIIPLLLLAMALPVSATPYCQHQGKGPEWTDDRQDHHRCQRAHQVHRSAPPLLAIKPARHAPARAAKS